MKLMFTVSDEAWRKLSDPERQMLVARLREPLFARFIELQRAAAIEQASSLNPSNFSDEMALEYLNQAKQLRLIEGFWSQLGEFIATVK